MESTRIGKQFKTKYGNTLTIEKDIGLIKRVRYYEVSCNICNLDKELHKDNFISSYGNLSKGQVPCGCSKSVRWDNHQFDILISRSSIKKKIHYIGITELVDGKINCKISRVICRCYICNYEYSSSVDKFINSDRGCTKCGRICSSNKQKTDIKIVLENINNIFHSEGYTFDGFVGIYKNKDSRIKYSCNKHPNIHLEMSYHNMLNGRRCPICSTRGYDESKPGWLYVFEYNDVYKFGITNRDVEKRSEEHIYGLSDIKIKCIFKRMYDDGSIPKLIEKSLKKKYKGVCDWLTSGNTETVRSDDLNDLIKTIEEFY